MQITLPWKKLVKDIHKITSQNDLTGEQIVRILLADMQSTEPNDILENMALFASFRQYWREAKDGEVDVKYPVRLSEIKKSVYKRLLLNPENDTYPLSPQYYSEFMLSLSPDYRFPFSHDIYDDYIIERFKYELCENHAIAGHSIDYEGQRLMAIDIGFENQVNPREFFSDCPSIRRISCTYAELIINDSAEIEKELFSPEEIFEMMTGMGGSTTAVDTSDIDIDDSDRDDAVCFEYKKQEESERALEEAKKAWADYWPDYEWIRRNMSSMDYDDGQGLLTLDPETLEWTSPERALELLKKYKDTDAIDPIHKIDSKEKSYYPISLWGLQDRIYDICMTSNDQRRHTPEHNMEFALSIASSDYHYRVPMKYSLSRESRDHLSLLDKIGEQLFTQKIPMKAGMIVQIRGKNWLIFDIHFHPNDEVLIGDPLKGLPTLQSVNLTYPSLINFDREEKLEGVTAAHVSSTPLPAPSISQERMEELFVDYINKEFGKRIGDFFKTQTLELSTLEERVRKILRDLEKKNAEDRTERARPIAKNPHFI